MLRPQVSQLTEFHWALSLSSSTCRGSCLELRETGSSTTSSYSDGLNPTQSGVSESPPLLRTRRVYVLATLMRRWNGDNLCSVLAPEGYGSGMMSAAMPVE